MRPLSSSPSLRHPTAGTGYYWIDFRKAPLASENDRSSKQGFASPLLEFVVERRVLENWRQAVNFNYNGLEFGIICFYVAWPVGIFGGRSPAHQAISFREMPRRAPDGSQMSPRCLPDDEDDHDDDFVVER